jgi:UDP-N-acetylglucosamine--N-acetylmuramyl-(pentapeptide) pyrophosphoryl-undecaprenol N-acetylglucosamine transferase
MRVTQQCRPEDLERVRAAYAAAGIEAELAAFFPDIADRIARAHIVVARAGASTVAELAVAGRPAILVPLPGAIDDHQTANARALAGATMMPQSLFVPETLTARLQSLLAAPGTLAAAAARAAASGRPQAASELANLVEALVSGEVLA